VHWAGDVDPTASVDFVGGQASQFGVGLLLLPPADQVPWGHGSQNMPPLPAVQAGGRTARVDGGVEVGAGFRACTVNYASVDLSGSPSQQLLGPEHDRGQGKEFNAPLQRSIVAEPTSMVE
jgi:hypothetical protein